MASAEFIRRFGVPDAAVGVVDSMIAPMEQDFLAQLPEGRWFSPVKARPWLTKAAGRDIDADEAKAVLRRGYERGLLDLQKLPFGVDYRLGDFFTFLDVYCVAEPERWAAVPWETRRVLDAAYLERYMVGLDVEAGSGPGITAGRPPARASDEQLYEIGQDAGVVPTLDEILPLNEVLERVLADERPVYLSPCDCRALNTGDGTQEGEQYCLSYRTAPGSYASRGLSKAITRREAADVVRAAHAAGLVQTANPNCVCNCGPEWCYLFRSQERLGTRDFWPKTKYRAALAKDACIACGKCVKRCPFGVYALEEGELSADFSKCVGCGLCVTTCPSQALSLKGR